MPPVGVDVRGGRCWFGIARGGGGVGPGHCSGEHVDDAAADVDVEGEKGVGGEVAEGLEGGVEGACGFGVEGEVDLVVEGVVVFWFHGRAD